MLHTLMVISPLGTVCGAAGNCLSLFGRIRSGVRTRVAVRRLLFVSGGLWGKGILPTRSRFPRIAGVAALSLTSRGAVILVDGVRLRAVLRFITGIVRAIASLMRLVISVLCNVWRLVSHLVLVVRIVARKCVGVRLMCFALSLSVVPCRGRNTR